MSVTINNVIKQPATGNSFMATTPPEEAGDVKSFPPTPTKKAWRRRLEVDSKKLELQQQLELQRQQPPSSCIIPNDQVHTYDVTLAAGQLTPATPAFPVKLPPSSPVSNPSTVAALPNSGSITQYPVTSAATVGGGLGITANTGSGSISVSPSARFFACGQCGKCFINVKYLEMHATALHAGKSCDIIVVEPAAMAAAMAAAATIGGATNGVPATVAPTTGHNIGIAEVGNVQQQQQTIGKELRQLQIASEYGNLTAVTGTTSALATLPQSAGRQSSGGGKQCRNSQWQCEICHKTFSQNSSYKNHQRTHSDERPFVCSICSIGFKERYHLKKHILFKHTNELREECRVCGKRFKDTTAVRAHERIHSDLRPYSCQRCQKAFKTSECLWHHENRSKSCGAAAAAAAVLSSTPSSGSGSRGHRHQTRQPAISSATTPLSALHYRPQQQQQHLEVASSVASRLHLDLTQLGVRGDLLQTVPDLQKPEIDEASHVIFDEMQTAAVVDVIDSSVPGIEISQHTPTKVDRMSEVSAGSSKVTGVGDGLVLLADCAAREPVSTPSSSATTPTPLQVKVEQEMVLADYELTAMASPGSSSFYDNIHRTSVSEEAEDSMTSSNVSAGTPSDATTAVTTSIPDGDCQPEVVAPRRRMKCKRCDKVFATVSAFDKHAVVHSAARPYRCEKCDVGFKLKVHLKKHNLYRHSDSYHCSCRHCGKRFKDSSAVRLHERIHSTDRPFSCDSCGKSFKTRENLWGHRHRGPCGGGTTTTATQQQQQTTTISPPVERVSSYVDEAAPVQILAKSGQSLLQPVGLIPPSGSQFPVTVDNPLSVGVGQGLVIIGPRSHDVRTGVQLQPSSSVNQPHQQIPTLTATQGSDDWIAVLLSATANRRPAAGIHDVTTQNATSVCGPRSSSDCTSTSTIKMSASEQEELLSKALLLSRLLQNQYGASGGGIHSRPVYITPSTSSLTPAMFLSSGGVTGISLPTAVVTPIKRETIDTVASATTALNSGDVISNMSSSSAITTVSLSSVQQQQLSPSQSSSSSYLATAADGKAHLPPFETFRAHHAQSSSSAVSEVNRSPVTTTAAINLTVPRPANQTPEQQVTWLPAGQNAVVVSISSAGAEPMEYDVIQTFASTSTADTFNLPNFGLLTAENNSSTVLSGRVGVPIFQRPILKTKPDQPPNTT